MKLAVKWEVKVEGDKRSIQLYDSDGNKIEGDARWEGDFYCGYNKLTSLEGKPKENVEGIKDKILKRKSRLKVCRCSVEDLIESGWKCGCKT